MGIPSPPADLRGFPEAILGAPVSLWRVHRRPEPWFFASAGGGRFDLAHPRGTCYTALEPLGAFVEHFGPLIAPGRALPLGSVGARFLSHLEVEGQSRLADLSAREALGRFGLTAETSSALEYERTREWAEALADAGFDGVRYVARHDPAGRLHSVALFGEAGMNPLGAAQSERVPTDLVFEAMREFGISVAAARLS